MPFALPAAAPLVPPALAALGEAAAWVLGAIGVTYVGTKGVEKVQEMRSQAQQVDSKAKAEPATKVETTQGCPQKNNERCKALKKTIENKKKDIQKRLGEMHEDPLGLPWRAPGDETKPSLSRWGHQKIIDKQKASLAADKAMYQALGCGDPDAPDDAPC